MIRLKFGSDEVLGEVIDDLVALLPSSRELILIDLPTGAPLFFWGHELFMEDLFSYQLSLLKQEMDMLQNSIRGYDSILFTIKGWAITVFSGIVLFSADKQKSLAYLFCIASVLAFWLLDAFYKSTQNILITRYRKVEIFLQSTDFEEAMRNRSFGGFKVPYFQEGWFSAKKHERLRFVIQAALQVHTFSLYLFLLGLSILIPLLF